MTGTLTSPGGRQYAISLIRPNMDRRIDKILCFDYHGDYPLFPMVPIQTAILHRFPLPHVDICYLHRHR